MTEETGIRFWGASVTAAKPHALALEDDDDESQLKVVLRQVALGPGATGRNVLAIEV